jgi:hypothetical protein
MKNEGTRREQRKSDSRLCNITVKKSEVTEGYISARVRKIVQKAYQEQEIIYSRHTLHSAQLGKTVFKR